MEPVYFTVFETSLERMLIAGNSNGLIQVAFYKKRSPYPVKPDWIQTASLFRKEIKAIQHYLKGKHNSLKRLTWRMGNVGTPFQRRVWSALRNIPCGKTATYGEIASAIGSSGAARAVGGACNANPFVLLVPCHRVIGGNSALTGFACGLRMKARLLKLENPKAVFTRA
jgi:methylated-DNA-[protein]-cysteine S-methyltransferase